MVYNNRMKKIQKAYRLTPKAIELIERLKEERGLPTATAVVEQAIRLMAEKENVSVEDTVKEG